ncbi:MAG: hypothetical protein LBM99_05450 [Bacillales bacterium]|jgi:hypothetical protein|nr:hypothetical protein [Bacillales bacterium]
MKLKKMLVLPFLLLGLSLGLVGCDSGPTIKNPIPKLSVSLKEEEGYELYVSLYNAFVEREDIKGYETICVEDSNNKKPPVYDNGEWINVAGDRRYNRNTIDKGNLLEMSSYHKENYEIETNYKDKKYEDESTKYLGERITYYNDELNTKEQILISNGVKSLYSNGSYEGGYLSEIRQVFKNSVFGKSSLDSMINDINNPGEHIKINKNKVTYKTNSNHTEVSVTIEVDYTNTEVASSTIYFKTIGYIGGDISSRKHTQKTQDIKIEGTFITKICEPTIDIHMFDNL